MLKRTTLFDFLIVGITHTVASPRSLSPDSCVPVFALIYRFKIGSYVRQLSSEFVPGNGGRSEKLVDVGAAYSHTEVCNSQTIFACCSACLGRTRGSSH